MTIEERLLKAIENKEEIEIVYHGGSLPGAARKIIPISINENKLRAFCLNSKMNKQFILEKISFHDGQQIYPADEKQVYLNSPELNNSLESLYTVFEEKLLSLGWYPIFSNNDKSIGLFTFFKNGKRKKYPDVSLNYDKFIIDSEYNLDTNDFNETKRLNPRPWSVRSKNGGSSFGKLGKGFERFLSLAEKYSPKNVQ